MRAEQISQDSFFRGKAGVLELCSNEGQGQAKRSNERDSFSMISLQLVGWSCTALLTGNGC